MSPSIKKWHTPDSMKTPEPRSRVLITHTCGHTDVHLAWGERIGWLESRPCPKCAGIIRACREKLNDTLMSIAPEQAPPPYMDTLKGELLAQALPLPVPEYRFDSVRRWRFDFAWPDQKIALEIEGAPGFGRHTFPKGFLNDIDKYNYAVVLGWRIIRTIKRRLPSVVPLLASLLLREYEKEQAGKTPLPPTGGRLKKDEEEKGNSM